MNDKRLGRIKSNIDILRGYLRKQELHNIEPRSKKCTYCKQEASTGLETCDVRTKQMKASVEKSIHGGKRLMKELQGKPRGERDAILEFLNSTLHHSY